MEWTYDIAKKELDYLISVIEPLKNHNPVSTNFAHWINRVKAVLIGVFGPETEFLNSLRSIN